MLSRRSVLFGMIAAPIVVRTGLIMPINPLKIVTLQKLSIHDDFYQIVEVATGNVIENWPGMRVLEMGGFKIGDIIRITE